MYELNYKYDDDTFSIRKTFPSGDGEIYDIDRRLSITPEEIAGWIFVVKNKSWMSVDEFESFKNKYVATCHVWSFGEGTDSVYSEGLDKLASMSFSDGCCSLKDFIDDVNRCYNDIRGGGATVN